PVATEGWHGEVKRLPTRFFAPTYRHRPRSCEYSYVFFGGRKSPFGDGASGRTSPFGDGSSNSAWASSLIRGGSTPRGPFVDGGSQVGSSPPALMSPASSARAIALRPS